MGKKLTIKVAFVCSYAAAYEGNFMRSLYCAERMLKDKSPDNEVIYVFHDNARNLGWIQALQKRAIVEFIPDELFKANLSLLKICGKHKVTIVHFHFQNVLVSALLRALHPSIRVVAHFHNTVPARIPFYKRLVWSVLTDKFVGCSKTVYDTLCISGFPKKKCTYVTNGIDFSRLDSAKPLQDSGHKRNLLIFGTHFNRKGCDIAISALAPIAAQYDVLLRVVTHNKADCISHILQHISSVPDWIEIVSPTEAISDYYRASSLFLTPSREEGFCYAVHEALYCSCPVIKTDLPAMHFDMPHEELMDFEGTEESLRKKIIELLTMPKDTLDSIVAEQKKFVEKKFGVYTWGGYYSRSTKTCSA